MVTDSSGIILRGPAADVAQSKVAEPVKAAVETITNEVKAKEPKKEGPKGPPITKEDAQIVAAEIEQALNDSKSTVIKFNVSLVEDAKAGSSAFKFQVVERETGRVVRQFPQEDILAVKDRAKVTPPQPGVLIDDLA